MFEQLDYPMDVIWLDIEHTDGKRYFTWDKNVFPTPLEMQKNVSAHGRKMVTIVDPHIKRDPNFHVHKEATEKSLYIKAKDGSDFGKSLLIYICNFHVLSHLLLIYICKLHWNLNRRLVLAWVFLVSRLY